MDVTTTIPTDAAPAAGDDQLAQILHEYLDVTQRLQRTHDTLQREVVRLRQELESKDRELERRQRLAALGELAAGVAHEVRNPLGAIQLYSGLLRHECGRNNPALRLIEKIEVGIQAIDRVVQDTLALTPRSARLAALPLGEIVDQAVEACQSKLQGTGVDLRVDLAADDIHVPADGNGLQRVLINLISNAAEAAERGTTITVRVEAADGRQARLRVLDAGPGLPEDVLPRIFDPFFTTKQSGTGLGLTIAHRLVEAHGGSIQARNRPEGGAEFIVLLPRAEPGVRPRGAHVA